MRKPENQEGEFHSWFPGFLIHSLVRVQSAAFPPAKKCKAPGSAGGLDWEPKPRRHTRPGACGHQTGLKLVKNRQNRHKCLVFNQIRQVVGQNPQVVSPTTWVVC